MKANYLFPHQFKKIGWLVFLLSLILGIATLWFDFQLDIVDFTFKADFSDNNLTNEIASTGLILGHILIGFSKIKIEDEFSLELRHDSLMWSIYFYYFLIFFTLLFIHGSDFLTIMIFSLFAPLVIFNIRFHYYLWRNEKLSEG